jgi:hypothetical protein
MKSWGGRAAVTVATIVVLGAMGYAYVRSQLPVYPYGPSHCCDKGLMIALIAYADQHNGWFPKGEASPEASLSLLYRDDPTAVDANLLRGKTVPEADVLARLEAGKLLTPETCGWHYVEGLRKGDDPRLALFWDKVGLGHNGEQLRQGGHWVCRVSSDIEYIPESQWEAFLDEQKQLLTELKREN